MVPVWVQLPQLCSPCLCSFLPTSLPASVLQIRSSSLSYDQNISRNQCLIGKWEDKKSVLSCWLCPLLLALSSPVGLVKQEEQNSSRRKTMPTMTDINCQEQVSELTEQKTKQSAALEKVLRSFLCVLSTASCHGGVWTSKACEFAKGICHCWCCTAVGTLNPPVQQSGKMVRGISSEGKPSRLLTHTWSGVEVQIECASVSAPVR